MIEFENFDLIIIWYKVEKYYICVPVAKLCILDWNWIFSLGSVCLLESSFFKKKLKKVNYFSMFGSVMKNKLENTLQCLVMSWKISWKITY
jgi:hypothetical protein